MSTPAVLICDDVSTLTNSEVFATTYLSCLAAALSALIIYTLFVWFAYLKGYKEKADEVVEKVQSVDGNSDGEVTLDELMVFLDQNTSSTIFKEDGAIRQIVKFATAANDARNFVQDGRELSELTVRDALLFAQMVAHIARPLLEKANKGVRKSAMSAISALDSMLAIASGTPPVLKEDLEASESAEAVSLDDVIDVTNKIGTEGVEVMKDKRVSADALRILSLIESAIKTAAMEYRLEGILQALFDYHVIQDDDGDDESLPPTTVDGWARLARYHKCGVRFGQMRKIAQEQRDRNMDTKNTSAGQWLVDRVAMVKRIRREKSVEI